MPAISEVRICNIALVQLGETTISSLTDGSVNADRLNAIYPEVRDDVLTDHIWNFAQKRIALATLAETPVYTDDLMTIMYQKPADCLKVNFTNVRGAIINIESDKILSDTSSLKIKYTSRVTDPAKFSPGFIMALAGRLAAELCYSISSKRSEAEALYKLYYDKKLPKAISLDSQEGSPLQPMQGEILAARNSGGGALCGQTSWETWYPIGS